MEVRNAQLDTSTTGNLYSEATGGVKLSEAKQTWWGMIGANSLESIQHLGSAVVHPIRTLKSLGQLVAHPVDTFGKVKDAYHDEWITSNIPGKIGVVWRGALDLVLGAKGAATVAKTAKLGGLSAKAGKMGGTAQRGAEAVSRGMGKAGEVVGKVTTPIAETIGAVIPEGAKHAAWKTGEQFRFRPVDNPLDRSILRMQYLEGINDINVLRQKADSIYFPYVKQEIDGRMQFVSTREGFSTAVGSGNLVEAQRLYREAVDASIPHFEGLGLTAAENAQLSEAFRSQDPAKVRELMMRAKERMPRRFAENDTFSRYRKTNPDTGEVFYDNTIKMELPNPLTGRMEMMTRHEFHEAIITRFVPDTLPPSPNRTILLTGGMPGSGKGTALGEPIRNLRQHVHVDPDAVKKYLPESRRPDGSIDGSLVHRESGDIAHQIYERAMERGNSILYDASMRDGVGAPWYNRIVDEAKAKGYKVEASFVFDGGEAWHRNSVLRDRALQADGYLDFLSGFDTIETLMRNPKINKLTIFDNSVTNTPPQRILVIEDGVFKYRNDALLDKYSKFSRFKQEIQ